MYKIITIIIQSSHLISKYCIYSLTSKTVRKPTTTTHITMPSTWLDVDARWNFCQKKTLTKQQKKSPKLHDYVAMKGLGHAAEMRDEWTKTKSKQNASRFERPWLGIFLWYFAWFGYWHGHPVLPHSHSLTRLYIWAWFHHFRDWYTLFTESERKSSGIREKADFMEGHHYMRWTSYIYVLTQSLVAKSNNARLPWFLHDSIIFANETEFSLRAKEKNCGKKLILSKVINNVHTRHITKCVLCVLCPCVHNILEVHKNDFVIERDVRQKL